MQEFQYIQKLTRYESYKVYQILFCRPLKLFMDPKRSTDTTLKTTGLEFNQEFVDHFRKSSALDFLITIKSSSKG